MRTTNTNRISLANSAGKISQFLQSVELLPPTGSGRGIVIVGGGRYGVCIYVAITRLREVGCTLPVELWYLGDAERDETLFELLGPLDVDFVDATHVAKQYPLVNLGGWEVKPYSILHSRFQEVLFLDADNVPIVDPTFLFDTEQYRGHGALFWPDLGKTSRSAPYWEAIGLPYREAPEFESGQMLIDRSRCEVALHLATWLCGYGQEFYWQVSNGDKDCFRAAWWKTGTPFSMPDTPVQWIDGKAFLQHDFRGRPLFQHRVHAKWKLTGSPLVSGFYQEQECLDAIGRLRIETLVRQFALTEKDLAATAALAGCEFQYVRCGHDERSIELDANGEIGQGMAALEAMYFVKQEQLHFVNADFEITCRLSQQHGSWKGRWERFEKMPITLRPANCRRDALAGEGDAS